MNTTCLDGFPTTTECTISASTLVQCCVVELMMNFNERDGVASPSVFNVN